MSLNTPVHFLLWLVKLSTVMKDVNSEPEKSAQQHSWEKGGLDQRISSISLLDLRALHFFLVWVCPIDYTWCHKLSWLQRVISPEVWPSSTTTKNQCFENNRKLNESQNLCLNVLSHFSFSVKHVDMHIFLYVCMCMLDNSKPWKHWTIWRASSSINLL